MHGISGELEACWTKSWHFNSCPGSSWGNPLPFRGLRSLSANKGDSNHGLTFYSCFLGQMQGGELSVSELGLGQWLLAQVSECRGERRGLVPWFDWDGAGHRDWHLHKGLVFTGSHFIWQALYIAELYCMNVSVGCLVAEREPRRGCVTEVVFFPASRRAWQQFTWAFLAFPRPHRVFNTSRNFA